MNKWVKKSIILANSRGYLDKLFGVYPISERGLRDIPARIKKEVIKYYNKKNKILLIENLLKLKKFPFDDPYVASLRANRENLKNNPKTIARIGNKLLSMSAQKLIKGIRQAISPSKQFGNAFKSWLTRAGYEFLEEDEFEMTDRPVFLKGGDQKLKKYAIERLGIKKRELEKGLDFIVKIKDTFILGEAKFLSSHGGTQDNQFNNAIKITKIKRKNVFGIAVLDGVVWFKNKSHMYRTIEKMRGTALSALLLKRFINNLTKI